MTSRRFSLFSLLLVVSCVAICLGWFVAMRQVQQREREIKTLKAEYLELHESTGQIDATDPEKIYIRNLKTFAPGIYSFRVAIPYDIQANVECRYEVDGQHVELNQPSLSVAGSAGFALDHKSHTISELTIFLDRNPNSWSIECNSNAMNLDCFRPVDDQNLLWIDKMGEGVPLSKEGENPTDYEKSFRGLVDFLVDRDFRVSMTGIKYDTRSFSASEEILLQEIWAKQDNKKHVIKFVLSSRPVGNSSTK